MPCILRGSDPMPSQTGGNIVGLAPISFRQLRRNSNLRMQVTRYRAPEPHVILKRYYQIMGEKEWTKYKVGRKSTRRNWTEISCQPFDRVSHITHISDAIRIIEDKLIRSSLVWDESKLNNSRTCVSWVSPNSWAYGSIYGNISFGYQWDDLVKDKSFYWVEDFKKYSPPAYRILITSNDYSDSELVTPYSIEDGMGPIYFDGKNWYRNGNYTGEFLIDQDLYIDSCHEIEFEDHHNRFCSKSGSSCKDIKLSKHKAGARFMANIIGRDITYIRELFWEKSTDESKSTFQAQGAINCIFLLLENKSSDKKTKLSSTKKYHLAKACLCALSENNTDFLKNIVPMIGTKDDLFSILKEVIEQYFECEFTDIEDW